MNRFNQLDRFESIKLKNFYINHYFMKFSFGNLILKFNFNSKLIKYFILIAISVLYLSIVGSIYFESLSSFFLELKVSIDDSVQYSNEILERSKILFYPINDDLNWFSKMSFHHFWYVLISVNSSAQSIAYHISTNFRIYINLLILLLNVFMLIVFSKNKKYINETDQNLNDTLADFKYTTSVSVLIAARNEEKNIEKCIRSLMNQSYANYEVLVMNDHSTDSTDQIMLSLQDEYNQNPELSGRLKYYFNTGLSDGWYGKSNSIQYLSTKATGEFLIITDADTVHQYKSIQFCVHSLQLNDVAFLSGFPKQNLNSFGSKLLVPSMYIMSSYIIPLWLIDSTRNRDISFAIGQLMVVRRDVFNAIGGLKQVSNRICEDLHFARLLKSYNYKTKFISMEDHVHCKMYDSFKDAFLGMSKNVFSAIDYNWSKYIYVTIIFIAIIYPVLDFISSTTWIRILLNLASILIFTCSWAETMKQHHLSCLIALFYPIMIICLFFVSAYSTYVTFFTKGHVWKGRRVV